MSELRENQIIVKKILLQDYNRDKTFDLLPYMISFTLSENLFSHYSKGTITLHDTAGFRTILPIRGDEIITFILQQPYSDDTVTYSFVVDSIVNATKENLKSESFSLTFISPSYVDGLILSHSKSYKNTKVSDILSDVVSQSHNLKNVDTTNGNIDFIIPNWTTNQCIRALKAMALNGQNVSDFVFFGMLDNEYHFRSVSELYGQDPKHYVYFRDKNKKFVNKGVMLEPQVTSEMFDKQRINSVGLANGSLGSQTHTHIPSKRIWEIHEYLLSDEKERFQQLNSGKRFWNDNWLDYVSQTSAQKYLIQQGQKDFFKDSKETRNTAGYLLENIVGKLSVVGDLKYRVGDTMIYSRPSVSPEFNVDKEVDDLQYGGKYLITSVLHSVENTGKYDTVLQISTDSFQQ